MPLAERRTRRPRVLPKRFRDDIPQPLVQIPPSVDLSNLPIEARPACEQYVTINDIAPTTTSGPEQPASSSIMGCFRTPRNVFCLLREYLSPSPPSHDPEELVDFPDLCDGHGESDAFNGQPNISETIEVTPSTSSPKASFGPYPNQSSFLLGEWYWNGGRQKSLKEFRSLLDIIGSPEFRPEDIHNTKWHAIDTQLGMNDFDGAHSPGTDNEFEWLDDAGWRKSPITISVPFHKRAKDPGAKDFFVGFLHYRSLTAVIKEKLSNPDDTQFFHYEPFKLLWQ